MRNELNTVQWMTYEIGFTWWQITPQHNITTPKYDNM